MHMMLTSVLAGMNLIVHSAGWLEGGLAAGYEKLIIDADRLVMLQRLVEGLDIFEKSLAMDAQREVGPGGHFLGCEHTQTHFRSAFHESNIVDTSSYEQWQLKGELTAEQRANTVWKSMLRDYEAPPLDPAIDEALQDYMSSKRSTK